MLPVALDEYLKAKRDRDGDALMATLVDDAVVRDEGHEYRGKDEIRAWHDEVSVALQATYQVASRRRWAGGPWSRCGWPAISRAAR